MIGNSQEAKKTLQALTKTQQHKSAVIVESSGNIMTESTAFVNRWTWYCSCLTTTNFIQTLAYPRVTRLSHKQAESLPVLRKEVEEAVRSLKAEKSPGVNNISSELL